jgi:hypothetical protein
MRTLVIAAALFATLASAQSSEPSPQPHLNARQTIVIFEPGDDILGGNAGPQIETVVTPVKPSFASLLRLRENFRDKLIQSVNEL